MQPFLYSEQPYAVLPRNRVPLPHNGQRGTVLLVVGAEVASVFFVCLGFVPVSAVRLDRGLRSCLAGSTVGDSIVMVRQLWSERTL